MSDNSNILDKNFSNEPQPRKLRGETYPFPGDRIAELHIASRPDCLRLVRAVVSEAGSANGCGDDCVSQMIMAVDEACQNIIRHAYGGDASGAIVVDIRREGEHIAIHLLDFAPPVDVSKVKPRDLDEVKPGGLGTHFIQQCVDECGFIVPPDGAGNCLRLVKKIT